MREFASFGAFARHLATLPGRMAQAQHTGLENAATLVEREAKQSIGEYQQATGPFNAWVDLSDATLEGFFAPGIGYVPGKEELGYAPPDNPLLREGTMRDSYRHSVEGDRAAVGSESLIALWQELGTADARFPIPPRSVLGGAASRKKDEAVDMMAGPIVRALAGLPPRNSNRPKTELAG